MGKHPSIARSAASREQLQGRLRELNAEIREYPQPIARCDAQLGGLVEERSRIRAEIAALEDGLSAIAIVVFDEAQILDVAGPMEILRGANLALRDRGTRAAAGYAAQIVAREAGPVRTSCGLTILASDSFASARRDVDTLMIAGGVMDAALADPALLEFVAATAPHARRVVAIGTGTFVLATAGLLEGMRATTHWRACEELASLFPAIRVEPDHLMVRDGKFQTSAGASAALDQTLALVQEDFGRDIAMAVAHRKVMFLRRTGGEGQVSVQLAAQMVGHEGLARLTSWILANTSKALTLEMLAEQSAMSTRTLARLFAKELDMTPARFIERARLEAARRLLEESDLRLEAIARKTGLGNEERLRRAFHRSFGMSPREYQENRGRTPISP
jgi:transcriptional regulator GlxA family with amidase domain